MLESISCKIIHQKYEKDLNEVITEMVEEEKENIWLTEMIGHRMKLKLMEYVQFCSELGEFVGEYDRENFYRAIREKMMMNIQADL